MTDAYEDGGRSEPVLMLQGAIAVAEPFPHFVIHDSLNSAFAEALLVWFEYDAPWNRSVTEFYEVLDINLRDVAMPTHLRQLAEAAFLDGLRTRVEHLVNCPLGARVEVTAHKLPPGCAIKMHTDYGPERQTHRRFVHINRAWNVDDGGILMFFGADHPSSLDDVKSYAALHGRAFAFAISPHSFHAVSTVTAGDQYTLTFSFYGPP